MASPLRTAEATPSPTAPPDPDDENMKKLLAGHSAYEELPRAAHASPNELHYCMLVI
jgi:hypothetical protein